MRRRFFVDHFEAGAAVLRGKAAHHVGRVLHAQPGQLYELSDGQALWVGRVARVERDRVDFALIEPLPVHQPRLRTILLLAIVKFDRFEWSCEKATELGVEEVVPLAAARSKMPLVRAAAKRASRWQKILLESAQQSRRLRPPLLRIGTAGPVRAEDAFREARAALKIVLSERPDAPTLGAALQGKAATSAALAVGPEGGWTDEELAAARSAGFAETSLGLNILRTETAVLSTLAVLQHVFGD
ncbi:MAG TPA: RsmE family RNA methyltransferase [Candidatus Acidoferrales bacterium]|nr:RsmE family RNA methyltransferase [Candidatus Acidoferrales bacterium]